MTKKPPIKNKSVFNIYDTSGSTAAKAVEEIKVNPKIKPKKEYLFI
tara:strand:+ start:804 stop:941 length:138 start_codon:yes stop_codon:yes gene_type:complete